MTFFALSRPPVKDVSPSTTVPYLHFLVVCSVKESPHDSDSGGVVLAIETVNELDVSRNTIGGPIRAHRSRDSSSARFSPSPPTSSARLDAFARPDRDPIVGKYESKSLAFDQGVLLDVDLRELLTVHQRCQRLLLDFGRYLLEKCGTETSSACARSTIRLRPTRFTPRSYFWNWNVSPMALASFSRLVQATWAAPGYEFPRELRWGLSNPYLPCGRTTCALDLDPGELPRDVLPGICLVEVVPNARRYAYRSGGTLDVEVRGIP